TVGPHKSGRRRSSFSTVAQSSHPCANTHVNADACREEQHCHQQNFRKDHPSSVIRTASARLVASHPVVPSPVAESTQGRSLLTTQLRRQPARGHPVVSDRATRHASPEGERGASDRALLWLPRPPHG